MDLPTPQSALAALASFVRERLADAGDARRARGFATLVVAAAAPFAQTSYARARLLRQMHASGLLSRDEAEQTIDVLGVAG